MNNEASAFTIIADNLKPCLVLRQFHITNALIEFSKNLGLVKQTTGLSYSKIRLTVLNALVVTRSAGIILLFFVPLRCEVKEFYDSIMGDIAVVRSWLSDIINDSSVEIDTWLLVNEANGKTGSLDSPFKTIERNSLAKFAAGYNWSSKLEPPDADTRIHATTNAKYIALSKTFLALWCRKLESALPGVQLAEHEHITHSLTSALPYGVTDSGHYGKLRVFDTVYPEAKEKRPVAVGFDTPRATGRQYGTYERERTEELSHDEYIPPAVLRNGHVVLSHGQFRVWNGPTHQIINGAPASGKTILIKKKLYSLRNESGSSRHGGTDFHLYCRRLQTGDDYARLVQLCGDATSEVFDSGPLALFAEAIRDVLDKYGVDQDSCRFEQNMINNKLHALIPQCCEQWETYEERLNDASVFIDDGLYRDAFLTFRNELTIQLFIVCSAKLGICRILWVTYDEKNPGLPAETKTFLSKIKEGSFLSQTQFSTLLTYSPMANIELTTTTLPRKSGAEMAASIATIIQDHCQKEQRQKLQSTALLIDGSAVPISRDIVVLALEKVGISTCRLLDEYVSVDTLLVEYVENIVSNRWPVVFFITGQRRKDKMGEADRSSAADYVCSSRATERLVSVVISDYDESDEETDEVRNGNDHNSLRFPMFSFLSRFQGDSKR